MGWILITVADRSSLSPGGGNSTANTALMFGLTQLLLVPLCTAPVWAVQGLLLWMTYRDKNGARLLLLWSTVLFMYLLIDFKQLKTLCAHNPFDRVLNLAIRVMAAIMQPLALAFLWSATGNQCFATNSTR